jgi:hypothetical protein
MGQIRQGEIRPPRQLNDGIPRELERICLKAMARRLTDRYSTAIDLAEDLEAFQSQPGTDSSRLAQPSLEVTPRPPGYAAYSKRHALAPWEPPYCAERPSLL